MGRLIKVPEYNPHAPIQPAQSPDLLVQLLYEHRQIKRLWTELQRAHRQQVEGVYPPDAARLGHDTTQAGLARELVGALAEHDVVERKGLYPAAVRVMSEEWADNAIADHDQFRRRLDEVGGADLEDADVFAVFTEVLTRLIAHIDEEESIVFPIMRLVLSSQDLADSPYTAPPSRPPPPEMIDLTDHEGEMDRSGDAADHSPDADASRDVDGSLVVDGSLEDDGSPAVDASPGANGYGTNGSNGRIRRRLGRR